ERFVIDQEALVDVVQRRWRLGTALGEERPQMLQPFRFDGRIALGSLMAEHVDVERPVSKRARFADHGAGLLRRAGRDTERAQPSGIRYRRCKPWRGRACHRRLNDRCWQAEQPRGIVMNHGTPPDYVSARRFL